MRSFTLLMVAMAILFIISGCLTDTKTSEKAVYTNISAAEGKKLIESEDIYILDVRTPQEYDSGHI